MELNFFIPGQARPAGSKTAYRTAGNRCPGGKVAMVDASGAAGKNWREAVRSGALAAMDGRPPTRAPVKLSLIFTQTRPKYHFTTKGAVKEQYSNAVPTAKPDATKLLRSVEDALTGICYCDDSQCYQVEAVKEYGDRPGVQVKVATRE